MSRLTKFLDFLLVKHHQPFVTISLELHGMCKSFAVERKERSARTKVKNKTRPFDDIATLSEISQIVSRSESLERATLDWRLSLIKSSIASTPEDKALVEAELAEKDLSGYSNLPQWPIQLEFPSKKTGAAAPVAWVKQVGNLEVTETYLLLLTFETDVALDSNGLHALEVAASILRHKILLGPKAPRPSSDPLEHPSRFRLSERQVTIAKFILSGLTNKEIAQELNLSAATIRYECVRLYERLGAKNRASAAAILQNLFSGNHNAVSKS